MMLQRGLSFLFGAFCVALIATKITILTIHAPTVPLTHFLIYLPTFFLPDVAAICCMRLMLRAAKGFIAIVAAGVGIALSLIVIGAASSQLGFFYETGGELEWHEASTFARDREALKVLLSGSGTVMAFGCLILVIAACAHSFLYRIVGDALVAVAVDTVAFCRWCLDRYGRGGRLSVVSNSDSDTGDNEYRRDSSDATPSHRLLRNGNGTDDVEKAEPPVASSTKARKALCLPPAFPLARVLKAAGSAFLALALIVRPPVPFNHMSVTLPVSLLEVFEFHEAPLDCFERSRRKFKNAWPFPDLIAKEKWRAAKGHFKGWAPSRESRLPDKYRHRVPKWLVDNMPHGFQRWDPKVWKSDPPPPPPHGKPPPPGHPHGPPHGPYGHHNGPPPPPHAGAECPPEDVRVSFYNPVEDPMKISNLDGNVLEPLKDALGSVKIKNVAIILMEALRVEMFPVRKDSLFYDTIVDANEDEDMEELNRRLAYLTPNIDRITGGIGGFDHSQDSEEFPRNWDDHTAEGFGGINVLGATTASTLSTKSFAANLCGTWPMAVENFDEADTESYQPCLPQIMSLLNRNKADDLKRDANDTVDADFRDFKWRTALFESMTETFDRQDRFDRKLGWDKILALKELKADKTRYDMSKPEYQKLGYLGFAEPVLAPYLRDFIQESTAEQQRMFMMHFTSITHHPWALPDWFNKTTYLPGNRHQDLDKYMNTIRFHDYWMGELMKIFDETGIADETLVVFAGDHGQAFTEDNKKQGTYENGHISNFRIPITFRHPKMPRVQYEANATSISILPTILDLLINTKSLNKADTETASDLLHDYEGQSVLRPYRRAQDGRRAWNFSIVNSGAGILGVTSADTHWRLVLPLTKKFSYRMTDLLSDPAEQDPIVSWSLSGMVSDARKKYGTEAAEWAAEAESVAQWWMLERKRLWQHA